MGAIVLVVRLTAQPGKRDEFLPHLQANAAGAKRDEPGCQRFEIMLPKDDPDTLYLHEVYDDDAALAAHREAPHYKKMGDAAGLIADREVIVTERLE